MQRIRLLPLVAAILFFLAGAIDARAGQYTLSYDLASDLSGSTLIGRVSHPQDESPSFTCPSRDLRFVRTSIAWSHH